MEVEDNPYAAPAEIKDAHQPPTFSVSPWLHLASKLLIAVASLEILLYALLLLNLLTTLAIVYFGYRVPHGVASIAMKPYLIIPEILIHAVFIARAAVIIRAGLGIIHRKDRAWARTAVNCSLLGIFCPFLWLDVPLGIWIWFLLRQDKYKQLFNN